MPWRLFYIPLVLLTACNAVDPYDPVSEERATSTKEADSLQKAVDTSSKSIDSSRDFPGRDKPSDSVHYPAVEGNYSAQVLNKITYHAAEVDSSILTRSWYGLFTGTSGPYLEQADLKVKRVEDILLDEKGEKTAWNIATTSKDPNVILVSAGKSLKEGPVDVIPLPKKQVGLGESMTFAFKGEAYKLYATGISLRQNGAVIIRNYRLCLQGNVKGRKVNQLLVSHAILEDVMVQVVFAGDLNRDGAPDLILNTAWQFNTAVPTLYLSRRGDSARLVEVVALRMSMGC